MSDRIIERADSCEFCKCVECNNPWCGCEKDSVPGDECESCDGREIINCNQYKE